MSGAQRSPEGIEGAEPKGPLKVHSGHVYLTYSHDPWLLSQMFVLTCRQAGDVHLGEVSGLQDDHAETMRHRLV